jgi:acetyltransferase-like isoleucine patch superfamily enzyme
MPNWLLREKYMACLGIAELDRTLGIPSIFGLTDDVANCFPDLKERLETMGFRVARHWHSKDPHEGYAGTVARGCWDDHVDYRFHYMNFDRDYMFQAKPFTKADCKTRSVTNPDKATNVVWHVDHLPYSLPFYFEFLEDNGIGMNSVDRTARIGRNFKSYPPLYIGKEAVIGDDVFVGGMTQICSKAQIGSRVSFQGMNYVSSSTVLEDDVFVGPMTVFLNDKHPPSHGKQWFPPTIKKGAVIGGGVTILPKVTVGEYAVVGAGSVVTKDVPSYATVYGNPAVVHTKNTYT